MATDILSNEPIAGNWQAAWAAYEAAKIEADEYERAVFKPAEAKVEALRPAGPVPIEFRRKLLDAVPDWDAINDKMEALNEAAYSDTSWQLLLTPAPDREALEWKMNLLFGDTDEDGCSPSWRMDGVNAFLADVRRMLDH